MISPKELKKLAAMCRQAGIKHYKGDGFEFTLTEDAPVSNYMKKKTSKPKTQEVQTEIASDSLTSDDLLFWSSFGAEGEHEMESGN